MLECAGGRSGNPAAVADLKKGDTVVDLGCGAGMDCLLAAKRVGSSGRVIGVDMSPEAIRAAEENERKIGAGNVEFLKGYLEKLPLEDESVDVAISNCVVPVMTLEETIIREALRVLKPGGQLVFNSSPPRDDVPADVLPGELRETAYLAKLRALGFAKAEVGTRIPQRDPIRSPIMVVATKATRLSREVAKAAQRLEGIGYSKEDIAGLPASAILGSGGSGNPVAFADLKCCETVVDLGCGAGIDCFLAAKRVGNGGKVIGVDMSPEAIAAAEENKRQAGASNIEFRKGYLEKLPLEDASVDVAISNCVGPVMRGDEVILREAFRVLKPGGRLVTTNGFFDDHTPAEVLASHSKVPPRRQSDYFAKLRAAGFTAVDIAAKKPTEIPHRSKVIVVATKGECCPRAGNGKCGTKQGEDARCPPSGRTNSAQTCCAPATNPDRIPVGGAGGESRAPEGMVLVPGWEFVRGGKEVRVSSFFMDQYEVTNEQYCRFVNDGNERHWYEEQEIEKKDGKFVPKPGKDRWPVVAVSWYDADAYAQWAGKRLPTDAEWLWAAAGKEGRTYPWGNEPITPDHANYGGNVGHPQPVGSYPKGRSPQGIYDLAGNVAEWCHDWFDPNKGQKIRRSGCSAMKSERQVNAEFGTPGPDYRPGCIGFRCVKDATR